MTLRGHFFMPYHVYILKSLKDNKYYIGSSADVMARLEYHKCGFPRSIKHPITTEVLFMFFAALLKRFDVKKQSPTFPF
jgi:predicted GIY-YIG superfamily endonuclease